MLRIRNPSRAGAQPPTLSTPPPPPNQPQPPPPAAHLDQPPVVVRVEPVLDDPRRERVPLDRLAPVHGDAVLAQMVLGGFQVGEDLARDLREVAPVEEVVLLDKDLAEARLRWGGWAGGWWVWVG